ncbi:MAG: hypothetical protein ACLQAT_27485 [Candidatus Binataceae bacterium]
MKIVTRALFLSFLLRSYAWVQPPAATARSKDIAALATAVSTAMPTPIPSPILPTGAANIDCHTGMDVSSQVQAPINAHVPVEFPTYNSTSNANSCLLKVGINVTGFSNSGPIIHGNGARLTMSTGNVPAWDFTGSQGIVMDNLFQTSGGLTPSKYGILMGRTSDCGANKGSHRITGGSLCMAVNCGTAIPGSIAIDMEGSEQNTLDQIIWVQADTALQLNGYPAGATAWPVVKSAYSSQCTSPQTNIGTVLINGSNVGMAGNSIVTNGGITGFTGRRDLYGASGNDRAQPARCHQTRRQYLRVEPHRAGGEVHGDDGPEWVYANEQQFQQ